MTQYIFATESYPFTADLATLLPEPPDEAILLTRDVHESLSEADRQRFARIVPVDPFDLPHLQAALARRVRLKPGARIVSHDDFFYELFAQLARQNNLAGYSVEAILPFVNKQVMKERLHGSGIRLPRYRLFDAAAFEADGPSWLHDTAAQIGYPMFAKPIQGAGAQHCALIADEAQFLAWAASRPRDVVFEIDEFIGDAVLYHCDSVIHQGLPVFTQVCRYSHPCADFARGRMVGSHTLAIQDDGHAALAHFTEQVFTAFSRHHPVPDGVTHMEMFRRASGEIIFLEVQFRPPGANVRSAYAQHLGVNLEDHHFALQMGRGYTPIEARGPHAAWLYFPTADGVVDALRPLPALQSRVVDCWHGVQPGQRTHAPQSILDARGRGVVALSLVIAHEDSAVLRADFERLCGHVPFHLR